MSQVWREATKRPVDVRYAGPYTDPSHVDTLEGEFEIDEEYIEEHGGYVIIRGVNGEQYPCALDIFKQTYSLRPDDPLYEGPR